MLPVALRLEGRRAVVVGGGQAAVLKVRALLRAGARVVVVAPEARPGLRVLAARGAIELQRRPFAPADAAGAFLLVTAAGDPAVNAAAALAAREQGALLCRADGGGAGDLQLMAAVRQGPLTLAVSSGAPALTRALRRRLAAEYGPAWGEYAALVGRLRRQLQAAPLSAAQRQSALRRLCSDELLAHVAAGERLGRPAPAAAAPVSAVQPGEAGR